MTFSFCAAPCPAFRLIPSRFPPIAAFDLVASPEDALAVMDLEGWTNDRLVAERVWRLPRAEWVFGVPNASVVMASFLHPAPSGARFNGPELGAWYAAASLTTAIAEVGHHLRREAVARNLAEQRRTYRCYEARLGGTDYVDIRGRRDTLAGVYAPNSYAASQRFGEAARDAGRAGIVFDSVRHAGGTNVVAYRPRAIGEVTQAGHYEVSAQAAGPISARRLA